MKVKQIFLFCVIYLCHSINIMSKDYFHMPTVGIFNKQQVTFFDLSKNGTWNLSDIQVVNDDYRFCYEEPISNDFCFAGIEHDTHYYYQQKSDTLKLWGFENHLSKVEYNLPEIVFVENLNIGDCLNGVFHGLEMYGETLSFRLYGTFQYKVECKGTLLLSDGDSLKNVTKVHYSKIIGKIKHPKVKSLDELRNFVFKEQVFDEKSIIEHLHSDDNLIFVDQYKLYADGYRYPIYETIETKTNENVNLYELAFYNPPKEQAKLFDAENEKLRNNVALYKNVGTFSYQQPLSRDVVVNGKIENGTNLMLSLAASNPTNMNISVYTANGILIVNKSNISLEGLQNIEFDVSKYNSDVYVVTYEIEGEKKSIKVRL